MLTYNMTLSKDRNVTLTCYIQPITPEDRGMEKRPVMIVLPGGGYYWCSSRESDPVAFAYLQAGYHVIILNYSIREHSVWPNPLNDYDNAVNILKEKADEWQIDTDRICVIGFSAGGHLAACCASSAENKPAAAILGYPCTLKSMVSKFGDGNMPDACELVDENTCPCFVFSSANDGTVPIQNSIMFTAALAEHKIPFESHIYAFANHGFTTNETFINNRNWCCNRSADWVRDSIEFLKDMIGDYSEDKKIGKRTQW